MITLEYRVQDRTCILFFLLILDGLRPTPTVIFPRRFFVSLSQKVMAAFGKGDRTVCAS
ncbi:MAG: hypothetical protein IKR49_01650 [Clostridia bacterium]|nr:hypothetical protein [Clostridia bacterium]